MERTILVMSLRPLTPCNTLSFECPPGACDGLESCFLSSCSSFSVSFGVLKMSMFAEATKKAASARFKQPQLDAQGQQIEVRII